LVIVFSNRNDEACIAQVADEPAKIIAAKLEDRDMKSAQQQQQREPMILEIFFKPVQ
jgi:hypothetical protein